MLKPTLLQLSNSTAALKALSEQAEVAETLLPLAKVLLAVQDALRPYETARTQLIQKYLVRDADGKPSDPPFIQNEGAAELTVLDNTVAELNIDQLSFDLIKGFKTNAGQLASVLWLFNA